MKDVITLRRWADRYCILAGTCDTITGAMLIAAPAFTLGLMRVDAAAYPPVLLQWIGAFVGAVGLMYFLAFAACPKRRDTARATILSATALARLIVGVFTLVSILRGTLPASWWSVPAADLGMVAVQAWFLAVTSPPRETSA